MTNKPAVTAIERTDSLPISSYVAEAYFKLEKEVLFNTSARYVGHELMVPNHNDYYTLEALDHAYMLVKHEQDVQLLSNICRHRQAIMRQGKGNSSHIVCPNHCWRYTNQGKLVHAPGFASQPNLNLSQLPLENWKGLLFTGTPGLENRITSSLVNQYVNFTDHELVETRTLNCPYNWKIFIETYLETYHVKPFHPGLRNYIDCNSMAWEFGQQYSIQMLKLNPHWHKSGVASYKKWQALLSQYNQGKAPEYAVLWIMLYPNIMIECYPHATVISTVVPKTADSCLNIVEFYHPKAVLAAMPEYAKAFQEAYLETAAEDDQLCESIQRGRQALCAAGMEDSGPCETPLEDGILEFYRYWQTKLQPQLARSME